MGTGHTGVKKLSRRYASALFALAQEEKALKGVEKDVEDMAKLLLDSEALSSLIDNPILPRPVVTDAFDAVLKAGKANGLTRRFFRVMGDNRRLSLAAPVIESFQEIVAKERGEITAEVTSAKALSKSQVKEIKSKLDKVTGKKVCIEEIVDEKILAGLRVRVGSLLLDDSLDGKLERLRLEQKYTNAN